MLAIICRGLPLTRANPVCTSTTLNDEELHTDVDGRAR
jgi:hypothetical protein